MAIISERMADACLAIWAFVLFMRPCTMFATFGFPFRNNQSTLPSGESVPDLPVIPQGNSCTWRETRVLAKTPTLVSRPTPPAGLASRLEAEGALEVGGPGWANRPGHSVEPPEVGEVSTLDLTSGFTGQSTSRVGAVVAWALRPGHRRTSRRRRARRRRRCRHSRSPATTTYSIVTSPGGTTKVATSRLPIIPCRS